MTSLETYLIRVREIRSAGGTVETSYYGALENLLNEHGKKLKPKVMCVIQMQNQGCGMPDGGLFTQDQYKKGSDTEPLRGQMPGRGVIEVKSAAANVEATANSDQVRGYLAKYGQVLVTNLREFLLVGRGADGEPVRLESPYRLATSEAEFWELAAHPRRAAERHDARLKEFLTRSMLHAAPLAAPEDVAWFLASYARDAKLRAEQVDLPALNGIRTALEQALGMKFEGEKGEHFFRSTLVQTLFYGLFSAWVLWHKRHTGRDERFRWHEAIWNLRVPMIRTLFEQLAVPTKLGPLGLVEVMDWATAILNRIDRTTFFQHFQLGHAVQYFYEPFLEAFDPELRKQYGVWYTPPEVVEYMVARVDTVLRDELAIEDGLADPRVYVLDPCCGTGAYLVEVLNRIHETLKTKGLGEMAAHKLKEAAKDRVFGFEILSAPFVIAHLQLGLLLENLGAPLAEGTDERVGVYLTNSLTGWKPPIGAKQRLLYAEMEEERDRADEVKQKKPILVILGNPPYDGFAGVALGEERELSNAYRTTKRVAPPEGQGLNELYVRFFRAAESKIVEGTGQETLQTREGIVCFISNYSWLDNRSCTGMRERYLEAFDNIWIDCLNGDKYKTGKLTPQGDSDPSVFSTPLNREGIQVGTAIALLVRKAAHQESSVVRFRDFWGKGKRAELLQSLSTPSYAQLAPTLELGLPFMPAQSSAAYLSWPTLPEVFPVSFPGVQSKQDNLVIDIDKDVLIKRIKDYFNKGVSDEELSQKYPGAMDGSNACEPQSTRQLLAKRGLLHDHFVRLEYRAFDKRWIYWEPETNLLGRKSPDFFPQIFQNNQFIEARQRESGTVFTRGMVVSTLADNFGNGFSNFFPQFLKDVDKQRSLRPTGGAIGFNLSETAEHYLKQLEIKTSDWSQLFNHVIAILNSGAYRNHHAAALRLGWPRIPLPNSKTQLEHSASLGQAVAALLDTECPVKGVTAGKLRPEIPIVAVASGKLKHSEHFKVTAGWGHFGKGGVTMPGKGRVQVRDYTAAEREAIAAGASALGLNAEQVFAILGERTCDVFLNGGAWWSNIPANVWEYTIGGYQVIKKWLSYREFALLGRPLKQEEVSEVMNMARRITAILLMQPDLDANYEATKQDAYDWPLSERAAEPAEALANGNSLVKL